jgi:hypothetical protein
MTEVDEDSPSRSGLILYAPAPPGAHPGGSAERRGGSYAHLEGHRETLWASYAKPGQPGQPVTPLSWSPPALLTGRPPGLSFRARLGHESVGTADTLEPPTGAPGRDPQASGEWPPGGRRPGVRLGLRLPGWSAGTGTKAPSRDLAHAARGDASRGSPEEIGSAGWDSGPEGNPSGAARSALDSDSETVSKTVAPRLTARLHPIWCRVVL